MNITVEPSVQPDDVLPEDAEAPVTPSDVDDRKARRLALEEDSWRFCTLADAYKPRPPLKYVVSGLLPEATLSILYGPPGSLKSLLMADLLACVAGGLPWLPPVPGKTATPRPTLQVPVLWLDFDNGQRRTEDRLAALGRAKNLPPDAPLFYVSMPVPRLDAGDPDSMTALQNRVYRDDVKLLVIDNLGVISAGADENTRDMITVMCLLRSMAENTGAAIIMIHHKTKNAPQRSRTGNTLRGHSSIEAALDLALMVTRPEGSPSIMVQSTKSRDVDVLPFGALFTYKHQEGTTELATAGFFGETLPAVMGKHSQIDETIIEILASLPTSPNQKVLVDMVKGELPKVGINAIRERLDALVMEKKVMETAGGSGRPTIYSLPG
jgi:hypothetical protein